MGQAGVEHQFVELVLVDNWDRGQMGKCWDCDICGVEFEVGDVMAEHRVEERDVGQGSGWERYWFSRIHAWHYSVQPRC